MTVMMGLELGCLFNFVFRSLEISIVLWVYQEFSRVLDGL